MDFQDDCYSAMEVRKSKAYTLSDQSYKFSVKKHGQLMIDLNSIQTYASFFLELTFL